MGCHLEPAVMEGLAQEPEQDLGNQNMALKSKKKKTMQDYFGDKVVT